MGARRTLRQYPLQRKKNDGSHQFQSNELQAERMRTIDPQPYKSPY